MRSGSKAQWSKCVGAGPACVAIRPRRPATTESGFTLVGLLIAVVAVNVALGVAMTTWVDIDRRASEVELIWRGNQYVRAIECYKTAKGGALPAKIEDLLEEKCIRRLFKDPMTRSGEWRLLRMSDLQALQAEQAAVGMGVPGVVGATGAAGASGTSQGSPGIGGLPGVGGTRLGAGRGVRSALGSGPTAGQDGGGSRAETLTGAAGDAFAATMDIPDRLPTGMSGGQAAAGGFGRAGVGGGGMAQIGSLLQTRMEQIRASRSARFGSLGSGDATDGIIGVASTSTREGLRTIRDPLKKRYSEWWFVDVGGA